MLILTDQNFKETISKSDKPVLVDFWMPHCAPCFLISLILEKLSNDFGGKVTFAKVNLNAAPLTAQKYGIDRVPTIFLFKEGKPVSGFFGVRSESEIRSWLEDLLK